MRRKIGKHKHLYKVVPDDPEWNCVDFRCFYCGDLFRINRRTLRRILLRGKVLNVKLMRSSSKWRNS